MSTADLHHPAPAPSPSLPSDLDIPSPQQESARETRDPISDVVSSVVDDIIKDAVFAASLNEEKQKVQKLINDLVTRVKNEAADTVIASHSEASPMQPKPDPKSTAMQKKARDIGVAMGDHRPRRIRHEPLTWTQTMDAVTLHVQLPLWVCKNHIFVSFTSGSINLCIRENPNSEPVFSFDRPLVAQIEPDGCMWALEGSEQDRKLMVEVEKARMQWWARLFMEDDPADYTIPLAPSDSRSSESVTHATANGIERASSPVAEETGPASSASSEREVVLSSGVENNETIDAGSSKNLEDVISDVVNGIVSAASSNATGDSTGASNEEDGDKAGSALDGSMPNTRQKVLTRADLPKIVEQYKVAIEKGGAGSSESALQLATFYHHGIGVEQNHAEAARLYRYALENGALDPSAAFQLGLIYNQGAKGLEASTSEAVRWWRLSAGLGNSVAMFNLGVMYMNGSGCDMDPVMATRWFQQAQALNPQLQPPQFTRAQFEERLEMAMKLKKERMRSALSPEEKQRRKEAALQKVRTLGYGSAAILTMGVSVMAIRYWWRNRL